MVTSYELELILKYFPRKPIDVVETSGIDVGYILKFEKFYLKLYKDRSNRYFSLFLYRYGKNEVITSYGIPVSESKMKKCIEDIFWEFESMVFCGY